MPRPGDIVAGKYRVERVIGRGGMGYVVAATHLGLELPIAIKFLRPEVCTHSKAIARFLREARATARMESENVVRVLDLGMLDDAPYIVMEYLQGRTLGEELARRGVFTSDDACRYLVQACDALAEAHALGIVHRDLKPGNLFLTRKRTGQTVLKVLDFGVSKVLPSGAGREPTLTDTHSVLGTPLYVSPEQLANASDVDARADVWALGIILYQLLAGRVPFTGTTLPKLFARISDEPPPQIGRTEVPIELEELVRSCLAKRPDGRPTNAGELGLALRQFTELDPVRVARLSCFSGKDTLPPGAAEDTWSDAKIEVVPFTPSLETPRSSPNPAPPSPGRSASAPRKRKAIRSRQFTAALGGLIVSTAIGMILLLAWQLWRGRPPMQAPSPPTSEQAAPPR
jgi:serine/threonine-protein kinase